MQIFQRAAGAMLAGIVPAALLLLVTGGIVAAQDVPAAGAGQSDLRINEIMASNGTTLVDPDEVDETPDWIEIYNPTASPVSLTGMALTDDPADALKHIITQTLTIPANGFLILYADNDPEQGPAHLSFGLSAAGEYIGLYQVGSSGTFLKVDETDFPALGTDLSYARTIDGGGTWEITRPTPGKRNSIDAPYITEVTTPTVSADTPAPLGPFTVTATITDNVGVAAASLVYYTATAPYTATTPVWVTATMASLGGNQYQGVLPAVPGNTLVRYYVYASDGEDGDARFPLAQHEYGYLAGYRPPLLLINEVVSRNNTAFDPDEVGIFPTPETPDWIEVYNPGSQPVSLEGLSLTNDRREPLKFRVPAGAVIPAGGLIVFLADDDAGQNTLPGHKVWHMNFTLNNDNDFAGFYGGEGTVLIDFYDWDQPPRHGGFGRVPVGAEWTVKAPLVCPTLGVANILCDQEVLLPAVLR